MTETFYIGLFMFLICVIVSLAIAVNSAMDYSGDHFDGAILLFGILSAVGFMIMISGLF